MQSFVYADNRLTKKNKLWEALTTAGVSFFTAGTPDKPVLAFTGSGGKTSLIYQLAEEVSAAGKKVLVVTTTHMYIPRRYGIFKPDADAVVRQMEEDNIVIAGIPDETGRIGFIGEKVYDEACCSADIVLIEADGSGKLPLKVLGPNEPVLPHNTNLIICVSGLSSLGKNLSQVCFRLKEAKTIVENNSWTAPQEVLTAFSADQSVVTPKILGYLWQQGCLTPLSGQTAIHKKLPVLPILNQADTAELRKQAAAIFKYMRIATGLVTCCR